MPTIEGKDTQIIITKDGQVLQILNPISFEASPGSELREQDYLGENRPRVERIEKAWTGSITYQVEDSELDKIEDEVPAIAKKANVAILVSKWNVAYKADSGIEFVDVTDELVKPFNPTEKTLKVIAEIQKKKPVPADVLKNQNH